MAAWVVPAIAAAASLVGGLLSNASKGGSGGSGQLSPVGQVQASTAPAMGDYIAKTLAWAAGDQAPNDFALNIGGQSLPLPLAAARRNQITKAAAQLASSLFRGSAYEPTTTQSGSSAGGLGSLFPLVSSLMSSMGTGTSATTGGTKTSDYWSKRSEEIKV